MHACDNLPRLRTHTAVIARHTARILEQFLTGLAPAFPAVRQAFPLESKTQRFQACCQVAYVAKNFGRIEAIEPWLRAMGHSLAERGFGPQHGPPARASMLRALRSCSGANWSPEIESDWREALDRVFSILESAMPAAATQAPLRAAA